MTEEERPRNRVQTLLCMLRPFARKLPLLISQKLNDGSVRRRFKEVFVTRRLKNYTYRPLPDDTCIRLLTIEPGSPTDVIHCSLQVVSLDQSPSFTALSYCWERDKSLKRFAPVTWNRMKVPLYLPAVIVIKIWRLWIGTSLIKTEESRGTDTGERWRKKSSAQPKKTTATTRTIICDGHRIAVQANLHDALLYLRGTNTSYWIDALCINQQDINERNLQVQKMGQIYSRASKVLIWLGTLPAFLTPALDVLIHLPDAGGIESLVSKTGLERKEALKVVDKMVDLLMVTAYLFTRRWFRRLWVVQESCLAQDIIFTLGDRQFGPNVVTMVISFLRLKQEESGLAGIVIKTLSNLLIPWEVTIQSIPQVLHARENFKQGRMWTLAQWLDVVKGRRAGDVRDVVFAGLALVQSDDLKIDQQIQLGPQASFQNQELVQSSHSPHRLDHTLWQVLHVDYNADTEHALLNLAACIFTQYGWEAMLHNALRFRAPPLQYLKAELPFWPRPSWMPDPSAWSSRTLDLSFMRREKRMPLESASPAKSEPRISADGITLLINAAELGVVTSTCPAATLMFYPSKECLRRFEAALRWIAEIVPCIYGPTKISGLEALVSISTSSHRFKNESEKEDELERLTQMYCAYLHYNMEGAIKNLNEYTAKRLIKLKSMALDEQLKERLKKTYEDIKSRHPNGGWLGMPLQDETPEQQRQRERTIANDSENLGVTQDQQESDEPTEITPDMYKAVCAMYVSEKFLPMPSNMLSFFITDNGYMGIAPSWIQEGDSDLLIPNASTPYIFTPRDTVLKRRVQQLREKLKKKKTTELVAELHEVEGRIGTKHAYNLVGQAYVEGVMNGEVAEQLETSLKGYEIM